MLLLLMQLLGANVTGLVGFGNAVPFPLAWGEVIPLHFIAPHLPPTAKLIVISQPQRRYTDSVSMIPELLKLGIFIIISQTSKVYVFIRRNFLPISPPALIGENFIFYPELNNIAWGIW